jgi:hypothetical protein
MNDPTMMLPVAGALVYTPMDCAIAIQATMTRRRVKARALPAVLRISLDRSLSIALILSFSAVSEGRVPNAENAAYDKIYSGVILEVGQLGCFERASIDGSRRDYG